MRAKRPGAREAIIAAATELIRVNGVAGTSISDVVTASGTSAGAIYHHFGSKERLVLEVGRQILTAPMSMIMATASDLTPEALFTAALDRVAADEDIAQLLLQIWAEAKSNPRLGAMLLREASAARQSIIGYIEGWSAEHSPETDAAAVVSAIMSLVTGYAVQRGLGLEIDLAAYRRLGVRMITDVCGPRGAGPTLPAVSVGGDGLAAGKRSGA